MQGNDQRNEQNAKTADGQPSTRQPGATPVTDEKSREKPQPLDRRVVESNVPADPDPDDPVSP